jgi:hypothetical protein
MSASNNVEDNLQKNPQSKLKSMETFTLPTSCIVEAVNAALQSAGLIDIHHNVITISRRCADQFAPPTT